MFGNSNSKLGESFVRKLNKKQKGRPKTIGYKNAHSVGLVYQIKDKDYQHFINDFVNYLSGDIGFKNIQTIGYYDSKEIPEFVKGGIRFLYINKKDLKLNQIPKAKEVSPFTSQEFDILIDLTDGFSIPLKYVFASTQAKFKIGVYSEDNKDFYDFMISITDSTTLQEYIDQVNHYLNIMNKTNE